MKGQKQERWHLLAELASKEQDPRKLDELVTEMNRLLAEKYDRLEHEHTENKKPRPSFGRN